MLSRLFSISYRFPKVGTASLAVAAAITAAVGTLALAAPSQATTELIGVQFPQTYSGLVDPLNNTQAGGGGPTGYKAGVIQQVYWNVANPFTNSGPGTGNATPITNSNLVTYQNVSTGSTSLLTSTGGTDSTTQFSVGNVTNNDHGAAYSGFPSPIWYSNGGLTDQYLAQGADFNNGTGGNPNTAIPVTLALTGLNAGDNYNLIAYIASAWYYGADKMSATLGSTTYYLTTDGSNSLTTWTPSTSTNPSVSPTADYVEFSGISGATLNSEVLSVSGIGGGLGGFQLQDTGSSNIPEPATLGLMAVAGAGLLLIKRRSPAKA